MSQPLAPITLEKAKNYLNIDFDDYDSYIQSLIDASMSNAMNVSGLEADDFNSEMQMAVLREVGLRFDNRSGGSYEDDKGVMAVYRRNSIRPMF